MKTLDSYFVVEMTQDELFLVNGGGAREVGRAIGSFLCGAAGDIETGAERIARDLYHMVTDEWVNIDF